MATAVNTLPASRIPARARTRPEPRLGLLPRVIVFLMPLVAAMNPVLPIVGPISPFPLVAAILFVVGLMHVRPGMPTGPVRTAAWFFAVPLVLVSLLTLATRFGAAWAHNEAVSVLAGLLAVLGLCMIRLTRGVLRLLMNGWLLTFAVTGVLAVIEFFTGFRLGVSYLDANPLASDLGIVSVFFNPNNYAAFLALSLPILIAGHSLARSKGLRAAYVLALIGSVPLMVVTNSRFGYAAMLVFIAVWLVLRWRRLITRVVVALLGLGAVLTVSVFANRVISGYWGDIQYSIPVLGLTFPVDASLFARWNLALNGLDALAVDPLLGAGPGGFEIHAQSTPPVRQTFRIINPHNGVIELLSQYGIVMLVLAVVLTLCLFVVGSRHLRSSRPGTPERAMSFALVSGVTMLPLILLMNSSYLEILHTWAALAVFVAIGAYLSTTVPAEPDAAGSPPAVAGRART
ncbi:O-antigen ligase family protein [Microbacterium sp. NPDC090218]